MNEPSSAPGPGFLQVLVADKREIARGIWGFELRAPDGAALPVFTPGSHLTVHLPGDMRRNYSLCSDPARTDHWQLAVKREPNSRGGSRHMCDSVQPGQRLWVSEPRNNFALSGRARQVLFIAGGIGITPILAMIQHLDAQPECRWRLVYCTRDAASTAFREELAGPRFAGRVTLHHDGGDPARGFDFWPLLEKPGNGQVYCCGPRPLMDAVADMSGHWPSGTVHFESFGVDAAIAATNTAFDVHLQRSGRTLHIGADQSILAALRADGLVVSSSCESGTCGSCRTGLLGGEAEHRDMVLGDDERATQIMVCVSRARSHDLVLDL